MFRRVIVNEKSRKSVEEWLYKRAVECKQNDSYEANIGDQVYPGYFYCGLFYTSHGAEYVTYEVEKFTSVIKKYPDGLRF